MSVTCRCVSSVPRPGSVAGEPCEKLPLETNTASSFELLPKSIESVGSIAAAESVGARTAPRAPQRKSISYLPHCVGRSRDSFYPNQPCAKKPSISETSIALLRNWRHRGFLQFSGLLWTWQERGGKPQRFAADVRCCVSGIKRPFRGNREKLPILGV